MGYFANGSEGDDYERRYCDRCVHQKQDDEGCAVWLAHLTNNYAECNNKGSILHMLIPRAPSGANEQCKMFVEET